MTIEQILSDVERPFLQSHITLVFTLPAQKLTVTWIVTHDYDRTNSFGVSLYRGIFKQFTHFPTYCMSTDLIDPIQHLFHLDRIINSATGISDVPKKG